MSVNLNVGGVPAPPHTTDLTTSEADIFAPSASGSPLVNVVAISVVNTTGGAVTVALYWNDGTTSKMFWRKSVPANDTVSVSELMIPHFKNFLYQEEKKAKEAKKGIKKSIVKDIKLSLFIGTADLERMAAKGREFLEEGNQLRLNLTLKGREIAKRDMGIKLLNSVIESLGDINVSKPPRLEGRVIRAVVARKK